MNEITIEFLRTLCKNKAIRWTTHALARMQERGINPSDVKNCILSGEIIEQYPNDFPYPSYLILGLSTIKEALHVLIGASNDFIWIITAYYPDAEQWEADCKTRKEK
ncbi:MAG TPA: DUF4258 domain-containing protein [Oscillospiraceae bacterium]|nr:DUF4258 domain-containing protein [Oscillospiraceae bacterium]